MTNTQFMITIILMGLAVQITRFTPFLLFGKMEKLPGVVEYLGKVLPAAMMGLLVIYCFKDIDFGNHVSIIPSLIATISIVAIHLWKRNTIASISIGTAIYMILLRII